MHGDLAQKKRDRAMLDHAKSQSRRSIVSCLLQRIDHWLATASSPPKTPVELGQNLEVEWLGPCDGRNQAHGEGRAMIQLKRDARCKINHVGTTHEVETVERPAMIERIVHVNFEGRHDR